MKILKPKLNLSSFYSDEIQKAYTEGVYSDSPANRKLGRVGMTYKDYSEKLKHGDNEKEDKKDEDDNWAEAASDKAKELIKDNLAQLPDNENVPINKDEANRVAGQLVQYVDAYKDEDGNFQVNVNERALYRVAQDNNLDLMMDVSSIQNGLKEYLNKNFKKKLDERKSDKKIPKSGKYNSFDELKFENKDGEKQFSDKQKGLNLKIISGNYILNKGGIDIVSFRDKDKILNYINSSLSEKETNSANVKDIKTLMKLIPYNSYKMNGNAVYGAAISRGGRGYITKIKDINFLNGQKATESKIVINNHELIIRNTKNSHGDNNFVYLDSKGKPLDIKNNNESNGVPELFESIQKYLTSNNNKKKVEDIDWDNVPDYDIIDKSKNKK